MQTAEACKVQGHKSICPWSFLQQQVHMPPLNVPLEKIVNYMQTLIIKLSAPSLFALPLGQNKKERTYNL